MPVSIEWIEPEVFLTHGDVTIYHTYKNDDVTQGENTYWFTADNTSDDNPFDVRELDVPSKSLLASHPPFLSESANPAFATASEEQKAQWGCQWDEWNKEGGGHDQAIVTIIKEGIDLGLISARNT